MSRECAEHIVRTYRAYILGCKRKFGTARSLVHYMDYIRAYLEAKALLCTPEF